ncbi:MAG: IS607 family transposase [Hyphomicrobiaceae bacterium]
MSTFLNTGRASAYLGYSVKTLQRWDREGVLVPTHRTKTGRRVYSKKQLDEFLGLRRQGEPKSAIAYCRVSSATQKADLKNQRRALEKFTAGRGVANVKWVEEVGGGLNLTRKKFVAVMDAVERGEVSHLIVAHKDRLVRFGFSWFERFCADHGCELLVLNSEMLSPEQEMVQDLKTIVHCFSCRLYGLRNYKKKLREALDKDLGR